jgi:hypothetical protein
MEITKEMLEGKIQSVHTQGVRAAEIVQQAIGAEMVMRELLAELEAEKETDDSA